MAIIIFSFFYNAVRNEREYKMYLSSVNSINFGSIKLTAHKKEQDDKAAGNLNDLSTSIKIISRGNYEEI